MVGLPKVKDVDEYSARYGSYDTAQQEVPRVKTARQPNHVVFTAETKKKNQQSGQSYLDSVRLFFFKMFSKTFLTTDTLN